MQEALFMQMYDEDLKNELPKPEKDADGLTKGEKEAGEKVAAKSSDADPDIPKDLADAPVKEGGESSLNKHAKAVPGKSSLEEPLEEGESKTDLK